jgi:DNA-binding transcriptional LysR family regulator
LPYAKSLYGEYIRLQEQVSQLNGLQSGLVRIGTFSSVATYWLPKIIKRFQQDYPKIDYELLLGDYDEIEQWIDQGRVDCGFLRLPVRKKELQTKTLAQDRLLAVLPIDHPLAKLDKFPIEKLCDYPFMLLEKGAKGEISEIFEKNRLTPNIKFTTWDDYAIMSMVESGLGISILPELILQRVPYKIVAKELSVPAYREIGFVVKDEKNLPLAVKKFEEYLKYLNE